MASQDYNERNAPVPHAPSFLQRRQPDLSRETEPTMAGEKPTILEEMTRRAKIRSGNRDGEDLSPFDQVRRDYRTLQDDNVILIEDLRHAILAEEVMRYKLEETERERDWLKGENARISTTMGSMTRALRTGGNAFNEAMKEAADWLAKHPEGVEAYRPTPGMGKIKTGPEAAAETAPMTEEVRHDG